MDRHIAFITLTWMKVMAFHIQKKSKILQHIHIISPLCINMIVVLLIILLNLMMLPKESKNKATIEQKKYQLIENHKYFFFHSQMIQGSFHINVRNHFKKKKCVQLQMEQKWDGWNYQWSEREMVWRVVTSVIYYIHVSCIW